MMDKLNIVQKTVMALILATMVLLVAVPLLAFTTVAFSNSVEMTEFPKRLIPKRTVTVKVAPTSEGEFEIFYDSGEGYESIITTKRASKLEAHFTRQYAVTKIPMFAMQCSNPLTTNPEIHITIIRNLPASLFNFIPQSTPRQTKKLQSTALKNICPSGILNLFPINPAK